jgi:hypothetical protein
MAQDNDSDNRLDGTVEESSAPLTGNDAGMGPSSRLAQTTDKEKEEVYSCFTSGEKWGIISLISLASIFSSVPISK